MRVRGFLLFAVAAAVALGFASCSEEDDTVEEFPGWQARNEAYFNHLSDSVAELLRLDPSRTDWKRIKSWSKDSEAVGVNSDYIVVNVVEEGDPASATPLYTDTVSVHYRGRLLPSVSYTQGLVFDESFTGDFDPDVAHPFTFAVGASSGSALIDGFATALQHMRRGDHWIVYIPHQLGYGSRANGSIPAFSTLTFDLRLVDFWPPEISED